MAKDYYQVLGVQKNASPEEIKKAYKKLAKENHPDVVSNSSKESAEVRFKEINEAYQVLGNPEKRKMYDQYGHVGNGFAGSQAGNQGFGGFQQGQWGPFTYTYSTKGSGSPYGFEDFDPFDVFEEFFGFRGFGGRRTPKKGKSLRYEMVIEFKDAVFGLEKEISVESGKVKIKIPAGVRNGTELKFAEKGLSGDSGIPPGDLFIVVRYNSPKEFDISGRNIIVTRYIDFVDATIGGDVEVPVVDLTKKDGVGKTKLKIPPGTQHGTRFVIKGKGMPLVNSNSQGDVLVQVGIEIPKKLSKKQKDLLEQFRKH